MAELRKDIVTGRWVIIATSRGKRPTDFSPEDQLIGDTSNCPFCYGNENKTPSEIYADRPNGGPANSADWTIRVIPNKYPALSSEELLSKSGEGIYDKMSGFGNHEVVVETGDHYKVFQELTLGETQKVLTVFQDRIEDLHRDERNKYVLVFKNEGPNAGATLSHTHSQIIATPVTPKRVIEEISGSKDYFEDKERCLFCDIIAEEKSSGERIVYENDHYISYCPYASRFPFEICVLPKYHQMDFYGSRAHITDMAKALKITLSKLSVVLNKPQYNFIIHTSPNRNNPQGLWHNISDCFHWHFEIMPRLVKVAGFEWGSGFYINPTSPEDAAKYLREAVVEEE